MLLWDGDILKDIYYLRGCNYLAVKLTRSEKAFVKAAESLGKNDLSAPFGMPSAPVGK